MLDKSYEKMDELNREQEKTGLSESRRRKIQQQLMGLNTSIASFRQEVSTILFEIAFLEYSNQLYDVEQDSWLTQTDALGSKIETGVTWFDKDHKKVMISLGDLRNMQLFAHELKHAYQFEIGQISLGFAKFPEKSGRPFLLDLHDELAGYKRESYFGKVDRDNLTFEGLSRNPGYSTLPRASASVSNHLEVSNAVITNNQANLKAMPGYYGAAFRVNRTTYY